MATPLPPPTGDGSPGLPAPTATGTVPAPASTGSVPAPSETGSVPSTPPGATQPPTGPPPPNSSATPEPTPGTLTDPQGHDISRQDSGSERRRRIQEVEDLKPASGPDAGGGFDVVPAHLYYTSFRLRNSMYEFNDRTGILLDGLSSHTHAGGVGAVPEAFAAEYKKVANRFLEVWGKAVVSVGGAAVGLTVTANNYLLAEQASHPQQLPVAVKAPPDVLAKAPSHGQVTPLDWGGDDTFFDGIVHDALGILSGIGLGHAVRYVFRHALRHGKVADVTPGPNDDELPKIAAVWTNAAADVVAAGDTFSDVMAYLDNPASGQTEWQNAVKQFCSSVWGTTAWGKNNPPYNWKQSGGGRPALDVLRDTARGLAEACTGFGQAAGKLRSVITDVYIDSMKKCVEIDDIGDLLLTIFGGGPIELAAEFIARLDTGRLNQAVDEYNATTQSLASGLPSLQAALDEAFLSLPTYEAEEARAEAIGARTLNDFRPEHKWTVPNDAASNHAFPIDLAAQENIGNSHGIDKHVGKTDEQLAQRLRDQTNIPAASSFRNLEEAQRYTQICIDQKEADIRSYLASGPPYNPPTKNFRFEFAQPDPPETGHSITKNDYQATPAGQAPPVHVSHGVQIRVKPAPGMDPPFTLVTSTPT